MEISIRQIIQIALGVLFIALFAQLTIELPIQETSIPITGQTFAVLLVGYALHRKLGTVSILLYILLGACNLPVFADGESGWEVLISGSGGYLFGFVIGAYFVGWQAEKGWSKNFWKSLIAMFLGTLIILFFGVLWLTNLYDFPKAMEWGFYPFLAGGAIKVVFGAAILPIYFWFLKRWRI